MEKLPADKLYTFIERATELVEAEILPKLPAGETPVVGSAEWYLTSAFALANANQIALSNELLNIAFELDNANCDVYVPSNWKPLAGTA